MLPKPLPGQGKGQKRSQRIQTWASILSQPEKKRLLNCITRQTGWKEEWLPEKYWFHLCSV